jgi:hypothetical protein
MLKCPKCNKGFTEVRFTGWTVFVEGTATVNDSGVVENVGSLVARCSIKPGHEIEGKHVRVVCPECEHSDHLSNFPVVLRCFLTGGVGDMLINTKLGKLAVAKEFADVADRIVAPDKIDWERNDILKAAIEAMQGAVNANRRANNV